MLKQIMIGGIVGGLTLFFGGFISWAVMDWHFNTIQHNDGVIAVVENIESQLPEPGVYFFPQCQPCIMMRMGWKNTQNYIEIAPTA
jgi:hypothetical protein